jgi:hypothetical protein
MGFPTPTEHSCRNREAGALENRSHLAVVGLHGACQWPPARALEAGTFGETAVFHAKPVPVTRTNGQQIKRRRWVC